MKANELMIGDYVAVRPSGMLIKIAAVHPKKVAYHTVFHRLSWVRESLLEPIPLTQEILEKNGFICDGESWWYQDFRIALSKSKGVSLVCGRQKRFEFVHQLQHALRLCGIEKEIEL